MANKAEGRRREREPRGVRETTTKEDGTDVAKRDDVELCKQRIRDYVCVAFEFRTRLYPASRLYNNKGHSRSRRASFLSSNAKQSIRLLFPKL